MVLSVIPTRKHAKDGRVTTNKQFSCGENSRAPQVVVRFVLH